MTPFLWFDKIQLQIMKKENIKIGQKVYVRTPLYSGFATITSIPKPWGGRLMQKLAQCPHGIKNESFVAVETNKEYIDPDGRNRKTIAVCCHQVLEVSEVQQKPKTNEKDTVNKKQENVPENYSKNFWGGLPGGRNL